MREGSQDMCIHARTVKLLLGSVACFLCIGLLVCLAMEVGAPPFSPANMGGSPAVASWGSHRNARHAVGFAYVSKRRVPNGPDPIHNRRAGQSGRSPRGA